MKLFSTSVVSMISAALVAVCLPCAAHATALVVNAINQSGTLWSLDALAPTDFLSITADGTAYLQSDGTYGTNAAGVVVKAGTPFPGGAATVGSTATFADGCCGATTNYGALIATLTLPGQGTRTDQVFFPNVASGLGSPSPTTSLTYLGTFGSLFGSFADVPNATVTFTVADTYYPDNSGGFNVTAVPEPATWLLLLGGVGFIGGALRMSRRQTSLTAPAT